jgi:hypothetical protein
MVGDEVEDHVVAGAAGGEVLGGVVDHVVGAEGAYVLGLAAAADARHLGAHGLRKLHGESADAARRAVDEHVLPGGHPGEPEALQGGVARYRHGSGVDHVD